MECIFVSSRNDAVYYKKIVDILNKSIQQSAYT